MCRAAGRTRECKHLLARLPKWQSQQKHEEIRNLMDQAQDAADLERETMGIEATDSPACFPEAEVHTLFALPKWVDRNEAPISHVYVAIDPNTGTGDASAKTTSDFAVVAAYDLMNAMVICGLESIDARKPEDYMPQIIEMIKKLQSRPSMQHAKFILIHENNGTTSAGWVRRELTQYQRNGIRNVIPLDENELVSLLLTC